MPRANRYFLSGYVWHITHRCHKKEFLMKFAKDRDRWRYWLYEARKRYGLCILNYIITSNHIHLLVRDTGKDVIPQSMQLIAGRTAQEYNQRKQRKGAYWEDRYHATAVETGEHLAKCLVYIDLNMVRAGVVVHPGEWKHSGYNEIQQPLQRYTVIDIDSLAMLCGMNDVTRFRQMHDQWVEEGLHIRRQERNPDWSRSIAIGSDRFIEEVKAQLGIRARGRDVYSNDERYTLREPATTYQIGSEKRTLRPENMLFWDQS
jgi:putative transposase